MGSYLELHLCWLWTNYKAVTRSAVRSAIDEFIGRGLRWVWILSGPWVDRAASSALFSCGTGMSFCFRVGDGCEVHQGPGVAAAWWLDVSLGGQNWLRTVAERGWDRAPWLFQVPQPRLKPADLALVAWMGVSPVRSMSEYRAISGSPEVWMCVSPNWSLCWYDSWTAAGRGWNWV